MKHLNIYYILMRMHVFIILRYPIHTVFRGKTKHFSDQVRLQYLESALIISNENHSILKLVVKGF